MHDITCFGDIALCWVPSHVGIEGNERADTLAKLAMLEGIGHQIELTVKESHTYIKNEVKRKLLENENIQNNNMFKSMYNKIRKVDIKEDTAV